MNESLQSSSTTTNESTATSTAIDQAQFKAKNIVHLITNVVTQIKAIEAFTPIPPKEVLKRKLSKEHQRLYNGNNCDNRGGDTSNDVDGVDRNKHEEEIVHLFELLTVSRTTISDSDSDSASASESNSPRRIHDPQNENDFLSEIEHHVGIPSLPKNNSSSQSCSSRTTTHDQKSATTTAANHQHPLERDRQNLVYQIFIPLLMALGETYAVLDQQKHEEVAEEEDDENVQTGTSINNQNKNMKNEITKRLITKSSSKHEKPKAPKGLLSLSNYTDIASLLELLVCTSILPLLESSILLDIEQRIQHTLPKSLCGRLRIKSLKWGMDVLKHVQTQSQTQQKSNNHATKTTTDNASTIHTRNRKEERLQQILHKIQNAKHELSIVCNVISQIIVLERFRPMLLPRHITDVYATLFQLERLDDLELKFSSSLNLMCQSTATATAIDTANVSLDRKNYGDVYEKYTNVNWIRYLFLQQEMAQTPTFDLLTNCQNHQLKNNFKQQQIIDTYTQVKSYQSLLLSGKKTPTWLKARVGTLLTNIATDEKSIDGLLAIIDIFVVAASSLPTEEMTGASSRLGRTLCTTSITTASDNIRYYDKLLNQFIKIIDELLKRRYESSSADNPSDETMDVRTVGVIHTIWAVLENVSIPSVLKFFNQLVQGLYAPKLSLSKDLTSSSSSRGTKFDVMPSIHRLHALLLYTPLGTHSSEHVLNQFCTFLISNTSASCYDPQPKVESSPPQAPGIVSPMSQIIRVACCGGNKAIQNEDCKLATDTLKLILFTIISKCKLIHGEDSIGSYMVSILLQCVVFNHLDLTSYGYSRSTSSIESDIVFSKLNEIVLEQDLICGMEIRSSFIIEKLICNLGEFSKNLPSELFRLLLLVYFESSSSQKQNECSVMLPEVIKSKLYEYKIVSMMMLPILCEKCSPESIFMEMENENNGVLQIVALIISTVSSRFSNAKSLEDDALETQLSITSIVLSLLIAMLELGSEKRSKGEEVSLRKMMPSLHTLSTLGNAGFHDNNATKTLVLKSELAEMSSHAMAIIASRSVMDMQQKNDVESMNKLSKLELMRKKIQDAEIQLSSDQPPLRARAVVNLRHLARGYLEDLQTSCSTSKQQKPPSFITEVNEGAVKQQFSSLDFIQIIRYMAAVCIKALDDKESYVYQASVQTLVAIADVSPSLLMPLLIEAVVTSKVYLSDFTAEDDIILINLEQRIKIIEALIFTIRRRGDAIRSYSNLIMDSILFGKKKNMNNMNADKEDISKTIQIGTESYFRGEKDNNYAYDEYASTSDTPEERQIRVNTGGPVYNNEEEDVLRGALINILAELVTSISPSTAAKYCPILIDLGVNVLRLDQSRVVRRPAALLCREVYACSLRESEKYSVTMRVYDAEFTIALAQDDETLLTTLQRCIAADDVDLICNDKVVHSVKDKTRLYDPATVARCQEALDIRDELAECGFLGVVLLHVKSKGQVTQLDRFLQRELKSKTSKPILDISSLNT